jgi:hypothetical protein
MMKEEILVFMNEQGGEKLCLPSLRVLEGLFTEGTSERYRALPY